MFRRHFIASCAVFAALAGLAPVSMADPIPPALQKRVDDYRVKLEKWAANPVVIAAAKASNVSGGLPGMTSAKWTELPDTDPVVKSISTSPAGKFVDSLDSKEVNKVGIRDKAGNIVAANVKVILYNVGHRPWFKPAVAGTSYQADQMSKDPTTQIMGVQIATPIKDGAEIVGVMHAAITAN
jgi:hypothetical protein